MFTVKIERISQNQAIISLEDLNTLVNREQGKQWHLA